MRSAATILAIACAAALSVSALALAADDSFAQAARHYSAREWPQACAEFDRLLKNTPEHPRTLEARFYYGEALVQQSRYDEARAQFATLIKAEPEHRFARQAMFRGGEAAYLAGNDRAAARDLQLFHSQNPRDELNGFVLPYLGSLALLDNDLRQADQWFSQGIEQFPTGPMVDECRLGRAQAHERSHDEALARREYRELASSQSPIADQALLRLGSLENDVGDYQAAILALEQLAIQFPHSALKNQARLGRGYALYKLTRYRDAETLLAALTDEPALAVEASYWSGRCQMGRQDWPAAVETLRSALRYDAAHRLCPALSCLAAESLAQQGKFEAACEEYQRGVDLWPESPWADDALLGLIELDTRAADQAQCVAHAAELIRRFPHSPFVLRAEEAQAQALYALGDYRQAAQVLERCVQRKPDADNALSAERRQADVATLAVCYARLGRLPAALQQITALQRAGRSAPLVVQTTRQVAELAYAAGDLRTARDLFAQLSEVGTDADESQSALSGMAWSHFKAGDWVAADGAWERLLQQNPPATLAAEAALMRGRALEHQGRHDPALAMYRLVIDRYNASERAAEALWQAGRLHEQLQQRAEALAMYQRLIAGYPQFAKRDETLYRAAFLRAEALGTAAGDELWAQLRTEFPTGRFGNEATLRLAQHAIDANRLDEAEHLLEAITSKDTPLEIRQLAWLEQARLAMADGKWEAAAGALARLQECNPPTELSLRAAYLTAEANYHQGRYLPAAEQLDRLVSDSQAANEPWLPAAQLRRAQARAQLKDWSQALEIARNLERRFPDFDELAEVDYLIGRCLAAQAEFADAREAYERVLTRPGNRQSQTAAMSRWMIGETYFHQENYRQALAEYARTSEDFSFPRWRSAALLQAGKCHELLGEWELAASTYDQLIKSLPESEFADEALRRSAAAHERAHAPARQEQARNRKSR